MGDVAVTREEVCECGLRVFNGSISECVEEVGVVIGGGVLVRFGLSLLKFVSVVLYAGVGGI